MTKQVKFQHGKYSKDLDSIGREILNTLLHDSSNGKKSLVKLLKIAGCNPETIDIYFLNERTIEEDDQGCSTAQPAINLKIIGPNDKLLRHFLNEKIINFQYFKYHHAGQLSNENSTFLEKLQKYFNIRTFYFKIKRKERESCNLLAFCM